jgi:hypothetical protein
MIFVFMVDYKKHRDIDKKRWDAVLESSSNRLVYATSWYLDVVSPGWDALVEDDYKSIMPLPAKKKYGIPYLIQPKFIQQLGIFSPNPIDIELVKEFLTAIPKKFVWQQFNWNSKNFMNGIRRVGIRDNYELQLSGSYDNIRQKNSENTQRNIAKSIKSEICAEKMNSFCGFHELYRINSKLKQDDRSIFQLQRIIDLSISKNFGEIVLARNKKKEIIAGAFFLTGFERIIYLNSFVSEEGYKGSAMFLIMDEMIRKNAASSKVFDFEGSMIPGIARFFSGFGGSKTEYFEFKKTIF